MPNLGFFPAYWNSNSAKNTYCALEWSASDRESVGAADADAASSGAKTAEREKADAARKEAEKLLEKAEQSSSEAKLEAAVAERLATTNGNAPASGTRATDAIATAAHDADAAVAAVERAKDAADKVSYWDIDARQREIDGKEAALDGMRTALESKLDDTQAIEVWLALAKRQLDKAKAKANASDPDAIIGGCRTGLDAEGSIRAKGDQRAVAVQLACEAAALDEELVMQHVELDDVSAGYQREHTNCFTRKLGIYAGYPAMFNATTIVEARTSKDRAKRDVTPVVSLGFVFAPNAIFAATLGPWFAMADVAPNEDAFVWGLSSGVAVTADVFSLLR
jgi:hypothetical protein